MDISENSLHDVYITGISIKTVNDHFDNIEISLQSEQFIDEYNTDKAKILFKDCYKAKMGLQMWILGKDSIKECYCNDNSEWLNNIEEIQDKCFLPANMKFKHYVIELNTTGSIIEIMARNIMILGD